MVRFPVYYRKFICTGSKCNLTCCACWNISVDPESFRNYRRAEGRFGRRLRNSIDHYGNFIQRKGRCPLLNENNLCDIYTHLGKEKLCKTCRDYPRHVEIYGRLREISLSLSCPSAAELMLYRIGKDIYSLGTERESRAGKGLGVSQEQLLAELLKVREAMISIMGKRAVSVEQRMAMVLTLGHDAQRRLTKKRSVTEITERYMEAGADEKFTEQLSDCLNRYGMKKTASEAEQKLKRRRTLMCLYLELFIKMEPVVGDWKTRIRHLAELLYGSGTTPERYETWSMAVEKDQADYPVYMEHLMNYFLYVYVPGAVYDGNLYSEVKLAVFSCLFIREMNMGTYAQTGELTRQQAVRNACLYSRELEHSDRNMEQAERLLSHHPALDLDSILRCI